MSSNKTQNYGLHSWVPEDDFQLSEINENFAKLDGQAVQVLWGEYQGLAYFSSEEPQHIDLPVKPKVVFLTTSLSNRPKAVNGYTYVGLASEEYGIETSLVLDDHGFTVRNKGSFIYNCNEITYRYVVLY